MRVKMQRIDLVIRANVRLRRVTMGLTQEDLADRLRVSYQQVHKYENGHSRISVYRLLQIAEVLETTISALLNEPPVTSRRERATLAVARSFAQLKPREQAAVAELINGLLGGDEQHREVQRN